MKEYDVIIAGAGPAGGLVSELIAKKGFNVLILEEHSSVGKPVQCAGLVTPRVIEFTKVERCVLNRVRGANIHSPKGFKLSIESEVPKGIVIDRTKFDRELVDRAVNAGSELWLNTKLISAKRKNNKIEVECLKDKLVTRISSKILIGADGVHSKVAEEFQFPKPKEILRGVGMEFPAATNIDKEFVNVFVGNEIAPGFFAWSIPTNDTIRVGLCVAGIDKSPMAYFKQLLRAPQLRGLIKSSEKAEVIAGTIPLGPLERTFKDNVMLAGDAAAQVKPTSGGGLYPGLICAKYCAETAVQALELSSFSECVLSKYQNKWKKEVGNELKNGYWLRRIFIALDDSQIDKWLRILNEPEILKIISTGGDLDFPSKVAKAILKHQFKLIKLTGPILEALV